MTWPILRALALAAVLALACSCTAGQPADAGAPRPERLHARLVAEPTIGGQDALVVGNPDDGRQPLVILLHGAGGSRHTLVGVRVLPFTQELVDRGYLLAASDAHGTAWGTPASQRDYRRLYRWVAQRYPVGRVVLVSESMGGVAGLQLLAADAIPRIAGWIGVSPVTDLGWAAHDHHLSPSVAEVLDPAGVRRQDPMRIPPRRFAGERMVIYVAAHDTVVPARHARAFAQRLRPEADVELRGCPGGHASAACYRPDAVTQMLTRSSA